VSGDPKVSQYVRAQQLLDQGKSYSAVAADLGVDRRTLYEWRRDPMWRVLRDDLHEGILQAARDEFRSMLRFAVGVVRKALVGKADATQLRAAELVLDRAGLSVAQAEGALEQMTDEQVDELAERVGWRTREESESH
jgi:transposase-like protein